MWSGPSPSYPRGLRPGPGQGPAQGTADNVSLWLELAVASVRTAPPTASWPGPCRAPPPHESVWSLSGGHPPPALQSAHTQRLLPHHFLVCFFTPRFLFSFLFLWRLRLLYLDPGYNPAHRLALLHSHLTSLSCILLPASCNPRPQAASQGGFDPFRPSPGLRAPPGQSEAVPRCSHSAVGSGLARVLYSRGCLEGRGSMTFCF